MKSKEQINKNHIAYAYIVMFGIFLMGVLFVFFILPNLSNVIELSVNSYIPDAAAASVAHLR